MKCQISKQVKNKQANPTFTVRYNPVIFIYSRNKLLLNIYGKLGLYSSLRLNFSDI